MSWTSISASVLSALSVVKSTEAEEGRSRSSDFLSDVVSHCLVGRDLCQFGYIDRGIKIYARFPG